MCLLRGSTSIQILTCCYLDRLNLKRQEQLADLILLQSGSLVLMLQPADGLRFQNFWYSSPFVRQNHSDNVTASARWLPAG